MRFSVKYTTSTGEILVRELEGTSADEIRRRLAAEGHFPMEVKASHSAFSRSRTIKAEPLIMFNQELLALLKAGIPLLQSLELLMGHGKDPNLRSAIGRVVGLVKEGMSFSDALDQAGGFPAVYKANIVAGERSGTLPEVITRWLAFQQFAQNSRRRIMEALFYPAFLVVVLSLSLLVMFNFVLPKFSEVFEGSGQEMPALTQALLSFGSFMSATIYYQIGIFLALVVFFRWLTKTEGGMKIYEQVLLHIPRLGTLYLMYHSSVFTRTTSVLLSGGLPVLQALEVIQKTSGSYRTKTKLYSVIEMVRAGSSLHQSLERSKLLDPLAVEMTRVGEQSSALPEMMNHVADFFDQEVEKSTVAVTSLIGPVLILCMGVTVLCLLLAIYVPMFNLSNIVR
ncbi:MAG: type II secretion system F family protein [Holophagales bacterium]|jgi:type IV pilus assembly protein PilC|nr:type II secretion system F family protein [Holophagales bacterium]